MKLIILSLIMALPFLETIRHEDIQMSDEDSLIVLIGPASCHECYMNIDKAIAKIKNRNFKYYVLLNSENRVVKRKDAISFYKKVYVINPDKYIFFKEESDFDKFMKDNEIKYPLAIVLTRNGKSQLFRYKEIFRKDGDNIQEILSAFSESKEE